VKDHGELKQELCGKINGQGAAAAIPGPKASSPAAASWRDAWPTHEACGLIPPMPADESRALGADIVANGLISAITLWRASPEEQSVLLDGRSRLDGLELVTGKPVEIDPPKLACGDFIAPNGVIVLDGRSVDPYTYGISANICRRNLPVEQRRDALIKLIARAPGKSDRQIAQEAGVDHKTIASARARGEAIGEVSPVEKRVGRDGKVRRRRASPVKRPGQPAILTPVGAQARIDELAHEIRVRDARIFGLESDLKAAVAEACQRPADLLAVWSNGTPSELAAGLAAIGVDAVLGIMPSWKDKIISRITDNSLATAIAGDPSAARLTDLLERRLERDGINASAPLRKIRALLGSKPPTIDLKAVPAAGEA